MDKKLLIIFLLLSFALLLTAGLIIAIILVKSSTPEYHTIEEPTKILYYVPPNAPETFLLASEDVEIIWSM